MMLWLGLALAQEEPPVGPVPGEAAEVVPAEPVPEVIPEVPPPEPVIPGVSAPEPKPRALPVTFKAGGHVKGFFLLNVPPEIVIEPLLTMKPSMQGVIDGRLNLSLDVGRVLHIEAAHAITGFAGDLQGLGGLASTGVGRTAPEVVELSWTAFDEDGTVDVRGRTDRLLVLVRAPHLDIAVGRQPVSFGTGRFFTPLDLVNPFTPTTIDTEYKPGVDAVRLDGYIGTSGKITAVAAYQGSWDAEGIAAAVAGQATVGVSDLGLMYGFIRGDHVVGANVVSSAGPLGLHGDVAVTVPPEDEQVFVRAVFGLDGRPTGTTDLGGEIYLQTLGTTDPIEGFARLDDPRYQRGELWLTGIAYYGLTLQQEIVPTLHAGVGVIGSFTAPTALLIPSLTWSVSDNADVAAGGYIGLGKGTDGEATVVDALSLETLGRALDVGSEFGFYGGTVFVQIRAYF